MKIYFVRHGLTDDNKAGVMQGCQRDTPLNDSGREQAVCLQKSNKLPEGAIIYSSPMSRALTTCKIATSASEEEVVLDKRLVERDFGDWTGKLKSDCLDRLARDGLNINDFTTSIDGIETWTDFTARYTPSCFEESFEL